MAMQPLAFRLIAKAKCNDASRDSNTLETRKWQTLNAKDERDFTTVLFIPISVIGGEWDAHEGPSSPLGWLWKKLAGSYYCYTAKWLYLCRFKLWPSCCSLFFFFLVFFLCGTFVIRDVPEKNVFFIPCESCTCAVPPGQLARLVF